MWKSVKWFKNWNAGQQTRSTANSKVYFVFTKKKTLEMNNQQIRAILFS